MALPNISYETLVELVKQLPKDQKQQLIDEVLHAKPPELTAEEKIAALKRMRIDTPLVEGFEFSDRREDWYDDDGR